MDAAATAEGKPQTAASRRWRVMDVRFTCSLVVAVVAQNRRGQIEIYLRLKQLPCVLCNKKEIYHNEKSLRMCTSPRGLSIEDNGTLSLMYKYGSQIPRKFSVAKKKKKNSSVAFQRHIVTADIALTW